MTSSYTSSCFFFTINVMTVVPPQHIWLIDWIYSFIIYLVLMAQKEQEQHEKKMKVEVSFPSRTWVTFGVLEWWFHFCTKANDLHLLWRILDCTEHQKEKVGGKCSAFFDQNTVFWVPFHKDVFTLFGSFLPRLLLLESILPPDVVYPRV